MSTKRSVMILSIGIVMTMIAFFGFIACGGGGGGGGAVPTGTVTGTVLDSDNLPVEAATITISSEPVYTTSDASGFFSIVAESGEHTLTITRGSNTLYLDTISIVGDTTTALGELLPEDPYYSQGGRWYLDSDGDGYGSGEVVIMEARENGYFISSELSAVFGDCDDGNVATHPGAAEGCNGVDDDCDLSIDEVGCSDILLVDDDNGFGNHGNGHLDVQHLFTGDMNSFGQTFAYDLFTVVGNFVDGPDLSILKQYPVVVWFTGESYDDTYAGEEPGTITAQDQGNLAAYLDSGGSLFLSGQDILYDVTVNSFVASYLGVVSASEDVTYAATIHGAAGDSVSDGIVLTSFDADRNGKVDLFSSTDQTLATENGTYIWDTSGEWPGQLLFSPVASSASPTFFDGIYLIAHLSDERLVLNSCDLWAVPDDIVKPHYAWYHTGYADTANQFCYLSLSASTGNYTITEYGGQEYQSYPDYVTGMAAYAHTLLVTDPGGADNVVAVRGGNGTWKVIFVPFPFEGLSPENDRRILLGNCLDWLKN